MLTPYQLTVQIVSFVNEGFPGWVACEFVDVEGRNHTLVDKVPLFSTEDLDATSLYPQLGTVRCEILTQMKDTQGREVVRLTTARPDGVESTEGLSEFVVFASQLSTTQ